jgi:hypothetical protein
VTNQQKRVTAEIIAAEELLLEELILLCGERAWQSFGEARNVLAADQMREFRKRLCPSQFLEDAAQMDEEVDTSGGACERKPDIQPRMCGSRRSWSREHTWG